MDLERNKQGDPLYGLMSRLSPEDQPEGLQERILERVRQEKNRRERRSERRLLFCTIGLSLLIPGLGICALVLYGGDDFFSFFQRHGSAFVSSGFSDRSTVWSDYFERSKVFLPFAGIVLMLLIGDLLLRRHYFKKRHNNS